MRGRRARCSYSWALHIDVSDADSEQLTPALDEGLELAEDLARAAKDRSEDPRRDLRPELLTVEQLAADDAMPVALARRRITAARHYFFGDLSDAAIAKRVRRHAGRIARCCREPGCTETIPAASHGNRRYCSAHATAKARTRRSRRTTQHEADPTRTPPPAAASQKTPAPPTRVPRTRGGG